MACLRALCSWGYQGVPPHMSSNPAPARLSDPIRSSCFASFFHGGKIGHERQIYGVVHHEQCLNGNNAQWNPEVQPTAAQVNCGYSMAKSLLWPDSSPRGVIEVSLMYVYTVLGIILSPRLHLSNCDPKDISWALCLRPSRPKGSDRPNSFSSPGEVGRILTGHYGVHAG
ncbi:hypothetical protein BDN72DRAFT_856928 [Pluteus cervinus]|uniref:Uncharacterized protein n=1 Tax=Pluteus cervinus TaxID=181527 RepID=A0ACD3AY21_9AGAR|nr:hypothetical protein BDN72DRAFT_856928 [Pluteus cervinus]